MGTFTHSITLISDSGRTETVEALVDDSDPDTDLPQIEHYFQTAEAIRKAGGSIAKAALGNKVISLAVECFCSGSDKSDCQALAEGLIASAE